MMPMRFEMWSRLPWSLFLFSLALNLSRLRGLALPISVKQQLFGIRKLAYPFFLYCAIQFDTIERLGKA